MDCGINFVKYLLFIFNFIFTLCGLAILIVGVLIHLQVKHVAEILEENVSFPAIALIIVGSVIFTIAFFGCCGAIRESRCMIITFAMILLTILVIQVAVGIFAIVNLKGIDESVITESYTKQFNKYWTENSARAYVDSLQSSFTCCGLRSYQDFNNGTIPWSCCNHEKDDDKSPCSPSDSYNVGCLNKIVELFEYAGILLGGVAIGIAVVEFIGIIFALCLANSLKNAERRGYRV